MTDKSAWYHGRHREFNARTLTVEGENAPTLSSRSLLSTRALWNMCPPPPCVRETERTG